ncbi:TetR/AcrR family transcriptional regulator [Streptosporangium amethystogenes]|uniref:TetR/AcrR family transcriptional regulator n=1 Tax=Streptosporangium amethystogenes TaxID=2002 RepID=UPI0004C6C5F9|nr:TetR/AcrR family transcriptional regulator [Streptosporangium amethystogenes]
MPRISAATVADHRANQHAALLEAAREILAAQGVHALTPAAVGARIGLARSSVYRYFSSTADILAQLTEEGFPRWAGRLRATMAETPPNGPAASLDERLRAYGRVALEFVGSTDYALVPAAQTLGLPTECLARLEELHGSLLEPLGDVLREAGHDHPALRAELAWGVLRAGTRRLASESPGGPGAEDTTEIIEITLDMFCRTLR